MNTFIAIMFFIGLLTVFVVGAGLSWALDTFIDWFTSGE